MVKDQLLALARDRKVDTITVDLGESFDLDVETLDALDELVGAVDVELVRVRPEALVLLRRAGLEGSVKSEEPLSTRLITPGSPAGGRS